MELLTPKSTWEVIMALYYQVYQLKRNLGEVPCSKDIAEETHLEILEMLKACLQCRWGPTQPEGLRQFTTTTRTPAQVDFYTQMQMTCNHFGHFQDRQQESQMEILRVVRDDHCWALAVAAMLEGHIEQLSCSISCGWHGTQGQLGSHHWSKSRGCSRSRMCRRSQRGVPPHLWATLGMSPSSGCLQPAPSYPEGGSFLRIPAQIPMQKIPAQIPMPRQPPRQ